MTPDRPKQTQDSFRLRTKTDQEIIEGRAAGTRLFLLRELEITRRLLETRSPDHLEELKKTATGGRKLGWEDAKSLATGETAYYFFRDPRLAFLAVKFCPYYRLRRTLELTGLLQKPDGPILGIGTAETAGEYLAFTSVPPEFEFSSLPLIKAQENRIKTLAETITAERYPAILQHFIYSALGSSPVLPRISNSEYTGIEPNQQLLEGGKDTLSILGLS